MVLDIRFSTCPNDTFIFDALVNGRINTSPFQFRATLADIDELNAAAIQRLPDVVKVSYHAYASLVDDYVMLDAGSALGFGVGPLLVAAREVPVDRFSSLRVAIPGSLTTAAMLLNLAFPEVANTSVMLFSHIEEAVLTGEVDAGVLIHEGRFTYAAKGLVKLADLGELWEIQTGLPIPLGGIAVRRSLGTETVKTINSLVKESALMAHARPEAAMPYVASFAQEMDREVMLKHIGLYVNEATLDVGLHGRLAVRYLLNRLIPALPSSLPVFASELD